MTRCPECYGDFIAYPVPETAVVVERKGWLGASVFTLADAERETFIEHVDRSNAMCIDCKHRFDGSNQ